MKKNNNFNTLIIVLHEIYGLNQHMKTVCEKFSMDGYDIICPNLIDQKQPFNYDLQEEAYIHFKNNIGFDLGVQQVKYLLKQSKKQYRHVFLLGYSIGATIAWICSSEENMCDGIVGYYGSRIRDYMNITPECPALLIFPNEEKSFNVTDLAASLKKQNIDVHILRGKHGFSDPYSKNYCLQASQEAQKVVDDFLKKLIGY
ncbi:dienelactone hydrolase family protein [Alkalibaculum sp. M08DMB]|uniref:Dienelactone hydrolase family protein n=1 Tax=Alkalibaculum sporogenes TaxID=2655001 RepID=A0A6A7K4E0_9FIRM|nr:dienelactone hydrolase family protein [Alkalibaculum sporogenes]MPW24319.1 dienelactone hydrolase family protein [Alkalibaculum sporogenes]